MFGGCGLRLLFIVVMFGLIVGLVGMLRFKLLFVVGLGVFCLAYWFGCVNCLFSVVFGLFTLFVC